MLTIALGADHAGRELKDVLKIWLFEQGHHVVDHGTHGTESVDYPDLAQLVAEDVAAAKAHRGVLVCGTGIGMAIAANKVPGVRAAVCADPALARLAREHNDANVLALGARVIAPAAAREVLGAWLETAFGGGRHERRVAKLAALEARHGAGPRGGAPRGA
jgi:ribose 5-phosphate isomerase B